MKFEDVQLTGSLNVTGSFNVPVHSDYPTATSDGDLFYHTVSSSLFVRNNDEWVLISFAPLPPKPPNAVFTDITSNLTASISIGTNLVSMSLSEADDIVSSPYSASISASSLEIIFTNADSSSAFIRNKSVLGAGTYNYSVTVFDDNNVSKSYNDRSFIVAAEPIYSADIEYLVVGGGAGLGGNNNGYYGGGGGAGGFLSSSLSSIESGTSISVVIGGGSAAGNPSSNGNTSSLASLTGTSFTTVTALGGGGSQYISNNGGGSDGASGGGAPGNDVAATGGSGTLGQGHDGGSHGAPGGSGAAAGSGGGGAGGPGQVRPSNGVGGNGGLPSGSAITGTTVYYAGGGGGGLGWSGFWSPTGRGTYGTNFTGGVNSGGGGSYHNGNADAGDSGIVILAYDPTEISATGGTITDRADGFKVHTFTTSGTFTVSNPT